MATRTRPMERSKRRKQLLEIARNLVAKEGMGALTMTALSELADVAKPVVYSHFPNRQAVAIALLDEHFEALLAFVRARIAGATTLDDYVTLLVDASFEFEGASETPILKITNGFSAGDEVNLAFLSKEDEFRGHWERLLRAFDVPEPQVEVAAHALRGLVNSTVYTFAIGRNKKVARDTLKALLLNAIHTLSPNGDRPVPNLGTITIDPEPALPASAKAKAPAKRAAPKAAARRAPVRRRTRGTAKS